LKAQAAMDAAKNRLAISGQTQILTPDEQQALNNAMMNGGLDPKWINSRTAKLYADQEMMNPGRAWNQLSAAATYERSVGATNTKTLLNTVTPMLDNLDQAGKALGNSNIPGVNRIVNWAKEASGQPEIVEFNNLRDQTIAAWNRGVIR
jgi:hypothetical protein